MPPFANYPDAREGPWDEYSHRPDKNPVLRGAAFKLLSSVVSHMAPLQRYLWRNAGFSDIRDLDGLGQYAPRYDPCVIPLWDGVSPRRMIPFKDDFHLRAPPHQPAGRFLTAADYHAAYKAKFVTPLQVVEALLPLTRRTHPTYGRIFVETYRLGDDLVLAAARASTERWAADAPLGILDGVPFTVKDDTPVRGWVTHYGMRYDETQPCFEPAMETAAPVARLEEAGALMVGKVNMHELGCDTSGCNPNWGTPPNWYSPDHFYPGGSSSGSGSGCSVGLFPISVAGDSGGSLRIPAAWNGVFAIKPSHHRQGLSGSTMSASGPIAATAQDLAIAYRLMSQPDPTDAVQSLFAPSVPPSVGPGSSRPRPIGIYRAWWAVADPSVAAACERAIAWLVREKNYVVINIHMPHLDIGQRAHAATCLAEMAGAARTRVGRPNQWLGVVTAETKLLLAVGSQAPAADFMRWAQLRDLLMRHLAHLFRLYPDLIIATPTTPLIGWRRHSGDDSHGFSDANMSLAAMRYVWLANTTGCPAVSAPVGYVDVDVSAKPGGFKLKGIKKGGRKEGETATTQMPVGLQMMAQWGAEERLLAWAAEAEEYLLDTRDSGGKGRIRPHGWIDVIALAREEELAARAGLLAGGVAGKAATGPTATA